MNYHRIRAIGLIPSIMDYLSMVINIKEIYKCVTIECIWNNIEIMDTIGDYDFQTIGFVTLMCLFLSGTLELLCIEWTH